MDVLVARASSSSPSASSTSSPDLVAAAEDLLLDLSLELDLLGCWLGGWLLWVWWQGLPRHHPQHHQHHHQIWQQQQKTCCWTCLRKTTLQNGFWLWDRQLSLIQDGWVAAFKNTSVQWESCVHSYDPLFSVYSIGQNSLLQDWKIYYLRPPEIIIIEFQGQSKSFKIDNYYYLYYIIRKKLYCKPLLFAIHMQFFV